VGQLIRGFTLAPAPSAARCTRAKKAEKQQRQHGQHHVRRIETLTPVIMFAWHAASASSKRLMMLKPWANEIRYQGHKPAVPKKLDYCYTTNTASSTGSHPFLRFCEKESEETRSGE